jgi:hypothetical protein
MDSRHPNVTFERFGPQFLPLPEISANIGKKGLRATVAV